MVSTLRGYRSGAGSDRQPDRQSDRLLAARSSSQAGAEARALETDGRTFREHPNSETAEATYLATALLRGFLAFKDV